ncbi:MAG: hypothetical protein HYS27_20380 [Deltaproteobacteria bacterium]|nr:hypothetical protein [Deltaproteobacteria bacterium]
MSQLTLAEQLVLLAELANLDAKARTVADKLETVPGAAKKADEAVAALKKQLEDAEAKKEAGEKARRTVEGELSDERAKIRKWESRANELRGEREHAALVSEISATKRAMHRLEDTQLEHMEAIEAAQKLGGELKGKHDKAAAHAAEEWKKVEADVAALKAEHDGYKASRKVLLEKLPAPLTKRYEQIAAKRAGVGVGLIKGEMCSACKRMLPPQMCMQIRKGVILEACPSCQRLLVHEAMTAAATPPTTG